MYKNVSGVNGGGGVANDTEEEKKMEEKDVESLLHCWMSGGIK